MMRTTALDKSVHIPQIFLMKRKWWAALHYRDELIGFFSEMVGDPGIEPGMSHLGGVTVRCRTLQPVAQH